MKKFPRDDAQESELEIISDTEFQNSFVTSAGAIAPKIDIPSYDKSSVRDQPQESGPPQERGPQSSAIKKRRSDKTSQKSAASVTKKDQSKFTHTEALDLLNSLIETNTAIDNTVELLGELNRLQLFSKVPREKLYKLTEWKLDKSDNQTSTG